MYCLVVEKSFLGGGLILWLRAYTLGLGLRQVVAFLRDMGFCVGRESVRRWFLRYSGG